MTNIVPAASPVATRTEKTAFLAFALVVGLWLAIPVTRGIAFDAFATVGTFVADTVVNGARAFWVALDFAFGWLA